MTLVQLAVRHGSGVDDRLVVAKHDRGTIHRYSEVTEGSAQIDQLLHTGSGRDVFTSKGSSLDGRLELGESIGVLLRKCRMPVTALPEIRSW